MPSVSDRKSYRVTPAPPYSLVLKSGILDTNRSFAGSKPCFVIRRVSGTFPLQLPAAQVR